MVRATCYRRAAVTLFVAVPDFSQSLVIHIPSFPSFVATCDPFWAHHLVIWCPLRYSPLHGMA
jgi:hypothetical protein